MKRIAGGVSHCNVRLPPTCAVLVQFGAPSADSAGLSSLFDRPPARPSFFASWWLPRGQLLIVSIAKKRQRRKFQWGMTGFESGGWSVPLFSFRQAHSPSSPRNHMLVKVLVWCLLRLPFQIVKHASRLQRWGPDKQILVLPVDYCCSGETIL